MSLRPFYIFATVLAFLFFASCKGGGKQPAAAEGREFPKVKVPAVYTEEAELKDYIVDHYWDSFLALDGPIDSALILGVPKGEVEQAFANWLAIMDNLPLEDAQGWMSKLFRQTEAKHRADTSSRFYLVFSEIVSRYLYDPNSPLRDEDLYLPFVRGLAASPCTREDYRRAFIHEAQMCAMNPRGSIAPDFRITRADGRQFRLHQVPARYIILFFSNPGCHACQDIINDIMTIPDINVRIERHEIAVVNVYIDEDIESWLGYESHYPRNWFSGYDAAGIIRADLLYNVRAIPSLYLLDSQKHIILKDAPIARVKAWMTD
ncbi:MAG: DUF5106 domain-containing protein [Bacteroidales bacterium]|nr:DUF5106 domain-containing protein [Bacteroidales bacterium]